MAYARDSDHKRQCREYHSRHREEILARNKLWRQANLAKRRASDQRRRLAATAWIRDYKTSSGCERCGERHPAVLDFHHRAGGKEHSVSDMADHSLKSIMAEVSKCAVLCSNCHRKLHWEEKQTKAAS